MNFFKTYNKKICSVTVFNEMFALEFVWLSTGHLTKEN